MSLGLKKRYLMNYVQSGGGGGTGAVSFATDSWDVIKAEAERISNYYEINGTIPSDTPYGIYDPENGDTDNVRTITLSTNEVIQVAIIGMCHDTLSTAYSGGGTKAGLTLQMVDCLGTAQKWNSSANNDWRNCDLRGQMTTYLAQLPQEAQNVIQNVQKLTYIKSPIYGIEQTTEKLFILSFEEIQGTIYRNSGRGLSYSGEGKQYEYYANAPLIVDTTNVTWTALNGTKGTCIANGNSYINQKGETESPTNGFYINYKNAKGQGYQGQVTKSWWTRSAYSNGNFHAIYINFIGNGTEINVSNSLFVSFAFCI